MCLAVVAPQPVTLEVLPRLHRAGVNLTTRRYWFSYFISAVTTSNNWHGYYTYNWYGYYTYNCYGYYTHHTTLHSLTGHLVEKCCWLLVTHFSCYDVSSLIHHHQLRFLNAYLVNFRTKNNFINLTIYKITLQYYSGWISYWITCVQSLKNDKILHNTQYTLVTLFPPIIATQVSYQNNLVWKGQFCYTQVNSVEPVWWPTSQ